MIADEFLAQNSIRLLHLIPYSLYLTSYDFFLFSKCKIVIRERYRHNTDNIKSEVIMLLKSLASQDFESYLEQWNRI